MIAIMTTPTAAINLLGRRRLVIGMMQRIESRRFS
jgi:hypothetical protein